VVDADIVDLVKMIKCAKGNEVTTLPDDQKEEEGLCEDQQQGDRLQYNMPSWRNIGFEELDFGGGMPAGAMCYTPPIQVFPLCVTSLPCKETDGGSVSRRNTPTPSLRNSQGYKHVESLVLPNKASSMNEIWKNLTMGRHFKMEEKVQLFFQLWAISQHIEPIMTLTPKHNIWPFPDQLLQYNMVLFGTMA
jgi:hypothetical protein